MHLRHLAIGALASILSGCSSTPTDYSSQLERWQQHALQTSPNSKITTDEDSYSENQSWEFEVLSANPKVLSKWQLWRRALEQVPQAAALADPKLNFGVFVQELETRNGQAQGKLSLSQAFPWPGSLKARSSAALAGAEVAAADLITLKHNLISKLQILLSEKVLLETSIRIKRYHLELLTRGEEVVRTRWRDGLSKHSVLIKAQVELAKVEDELRSLVDSRKQLDARALNLLGREGRQAELDWPSPRTQESIPARAQLNQNPSLLSAQAKIVAAEHSLKAAQKSTKPNFSLGVEWTPIGSDGIPGSDLGQDALALGFGIEIPLRRAPRKARVNAAKAQLAANSAQMASISNEISRDYEVLSFDFTDAHDRLDLYRHGLISKGEQAVSTSLDAFANNHGSYLDYLDSVRLLLSFELAQARAQHQLTSASSKLSALCGISAPLSSNNN